MVRRRRESHASQETKRARRWLHDGEHHGHQQQQEDEDQDEDKDEQEMHNPQ